MLRLRPTLYGQRGEQSFLAKTLLFLILIGVVRSRPLQEEGIAMILLALSAMRSSPPCGFFGHCAPSSEQREIFLRVYFKSLLVGGWVVLSAADSAVQRAKCQIVACELAFEINDALRPISSTP